VHDPDRETAFGELVAFRQEFYECVTSRADVLFELTDALLCSEGAVRSLAGLSLAPEHRRGHGALYGAMNHGGLNICRLRNLVAAQRLPRTADGGCPVSVDTACYAVRASVVARCS
jgi:hypothetical protein